MRHDRIARMPIIATPGECAAAQRHAWAAFGDHATLPTQHPDFVRALLRHYLAERSVRLVEAVNARGLQASVLLSCGDDPLSRWCLAGDREVQEPGDALYATAEDAAALADLLCEQSRAVELMRLPGDSLLIPAFARAAAGKGVLVLKPAPPAPRIALSPADADPLARLSSRRRSDLRRAQRKADELGKVELAVVAPCPEQFESLFAEAVAVEAKSWKRAAGTAIACDPRKLGFFRDYLGAAAAKGQCRIATMRIAGRLAAMQLAVVWKGAYWLYKIGFDEAYARCSPGQILMAHAIAEAAREGLTSFEMMGEADDWIADLWTDQARDCVRLRYYPRSAAGLAALARDAGEWAGKRLTDRWSRWRRTR